MSIALRQGIGIRKCCKGGSLIPNPPPNACPLVLDGTGDSLTWANPRAAAIAPFNLDFSLDFWFINKETIAKSFTILSTGKEISGQFYDTIELKYDHTGNKLVVELKSEISGQNPTTIFAEFELHSSSNENITGLASISDKWIECAGNSGLSGGVHFALAIPDEHPLTNVLDASLINVFWNGQLLTASATQDAVWDGAGQYYTNFLTLGDYRGTTTSATASAVQGEFFMFIWRANAHNSLSSLPYAQYNDGYPPSIARLNNWFAFAIGASMPLGTPAPSDLITVTPNDDVPAQLNADAAIVCGPVTYTCATLS